MRNFCYMQYKNNPSASACKGVGIPDLACDTHLGILCMLPYYDPPVITSRNETIEGPVLRVAEGEYSRNTVLIPTREFIDAKYPHYYVAHTQTGEITEEPAVAPVIPDEYENYALSGVLEDYLRAMAVSNPQVFTYQIEVLRNLLTPQRVVVKNALCTEVATLVKNTFHAIQSTFDSLPVNARSIVNSVAFLQGDAPPFIRMLLRHSRVYLENGEEPSSPFFNVAFQQSVGYYFSVPCVHRYSIVFHAASNLPDYENRKSTMFQRARVRPRYQGGNRSALKPFASTEAPPSDGRGVHVDPVCSYVCPPSRR